MTTSISSIFKSQHGVEGGVQWLNAEGRTDEGWPFASGGEISFLKFYSISIMIVNQ